MKSKPDLGRLHQYFEGISEDEVKFNADAIEKVYLHEKDTQTLTIKVLSIIGGIMATAAFIVFLLTSGLYESATALTGVGAVFIAGGVWANRAEERTIIDTLSISVFLCGFVLMGLGLSGLDFSDDFISGTFILLSAGALLISRPYILPFVSILIINGSIIALILSNNSDLVHLYCVSLTLFLLYTFLNEAKLVTGSTLISKLYSPVRIGLILSLLSVLVILGVKGITKISSGYIWLSSIAIIAAISFVISRIFQLIEAGNPRRKTLILVCSVIVLLPSIFSPSISGAMLVILLSFHVNYRTGLAFGLVAFIYFIGQYYYDLNFTLLTKSIFLFTSGVFFIVLYVFTRKYLTSNEKV